MRKLRSSFNHLFLFVLLISGAVTAEAQQQRVTGKVRNGDTQAPVQGASVLIQNSRTGTTTDEQGNFSLQVSEGQTLLITALGYTSQEKRLAGEASVVINLVESQKELETVVVTALGIRREEKALGYSVTTVKGEDVTEAPSNNWTNALTGKVAGLNLLKSGGGPAGTNNIVLRGENSLTGNSNSLIVVDGAIISGSSGQLTGNGSGSYLQGDSPVDFGTSLNDINPEDIESISVLKGPGAAALYGARGANGAIIITTKNGRFGQRGLGITFNSNAMFESPNRWPEFQYDYGQGATQQHTWYSYNDSEDGQSTRSTSSAWGPRFEGQEYYQYDPATRDKATVRTPWVPYKNTQRKFFETGSTFTNSLTLEGGNANTSARLSLTNLTNSWIIPNTGYNRNTVALSVNQKISDKLQIASKVNYTNKDADNLPSTGYNNQSIMYFIRGMVPNSNIEWFRDYWVPGAEQLEQTRPFSSLLDNPYLISYEMLNSVKRNNVIGNISATYTVIKDLTVMVRAALDYSSEYRTQQKPFGTNKFAQGMFRTQNIFTQELNTDGLILYGHQFGSRFTTNFSVGASQMTNKYIRDENRADQLIYPGIFTLANSRNQLVSLPRRADFRVNSVYGLAQFGFDNFLFLDVTARKDWTSTLATPESAANTGFFYPSVNASAVLSDKFELPAAISLLKLRASLSGVGSGGTSPHITSYVYNATLFPGGLANPAFIANPYLNPLRTTSLEFGLDLRLLKNRVGIDVAVYENNTDDQIINVPIDRATGYNSQVANAGLVRNRGIELQLNGQVLKSTTGLNWNMYGTFAANRNRVVELTEGVDVYVMSTGPANRGSIEARPGGRMGDLYGIGYARTEAGDIIYNASGLPTRTTSIQYLGNTNPDFKAGIGNEFSYKGFRFNFLFDGQVGGVSYSLTHPVLYEEGKLKSTHPGRYSGSIGDGVRFDAATQGYVRNDVVATNIQAYYDAHFNRDNVEANTFRTDFIKLREVRIDYTIPVVRVRKLGLQRATLGLYGRDLLVISNWPSYDPEFGTLNDGTISAGFEIGQFPSTRSYGVALTIGL